MKWRRSWDIIHHRATSDEAPRWRNDVINDDLLRDRRVCITGLTWELMMRMVVLFPTSFSYPSVGAALKRRTASWASERWNTLEWLKAGNRLKLCSGNYSQCSSLFRDCSPDLFLHWAWNHELNNSLGLKRRGKIVTIKQTRKILPDILMKSANIKGKRNISIYKCCCSESLALWDDSFVYTLTSSSIKLWLQNCLAIREEKCCREKHLVPPMSPIQH